MNEMSDDINSIKTDISCNQVDNDRVCRYLLATYYKILLIRMWNIHQIEITWKRLR